MISDDIEVLTEKLYTLVLQHREEEERIIQQIRDLKERKSNDKEKLDSTRPRDTPSLLPPGTRVRYATNGIFHKQTTGTVIRHTKQRIVINPDRGTAPVHRARKNVTKANEEQDPR